MKKGISAIILAAGYGSRMGCIKPTLPLGKGTVIAQVAGSLRAGGIADITVVLGYRSNDIIPELDKHALAWVVNEQYRQGMFSSIQRGLETLGEHIPAYLILPVDIPLVRPSTFSELTTAHDAHPRQIIYPVFQGKRGHPPLIPACFTSAILNYDGPGGLRRCLASLNSNSRELPVADEGVLIDMDTPGDYAAIQARYENLAIPSETEALELLKIEQPNNPGMMAHALAVASVGRSIAKALNRAGCGVDERMITAAGVLHDIAKGQPEHARRGAELIALKGFQPVADVAGQHMDLVFDPARGVGEEDVVYLADKMVGGSEIVSLEKRLQRKNEQFSDDLEALKIMTGRMEQALKIRARIEKIIKGSLDALLRVEKA